MLPCFALHDAGQRKSLSKSGPKCIRVGDRVINVVGRKLMVDIGTGNDMMPKKNSMELKGTCDKEIHADKQDEKKEVVLEVEKERGNHLKKLPHMGIAMSLEFHLSQKTKKKIWNHEYTDVFSLLHSDLQSKEGSKEEEWELARRLRVPKTIENWT